MCGIPQLDNCGHSVADSFKTFLWVAIRFTYISVIKYVEDKLILFGFMCRIGVQASIGYFM